MTAAKSDRWKLAAQHFSEAVELAPGQPNLNYVKGVALCRLDRFDDAIEAFRAELKVVPNHALAMTEIGTCLARTGRRGEGIAYLVDGLTINPRLAPAHYSLGLALLTDGHREEAIRALDNSISLDAGFADAYRTRGLAFAMGGEYDLAANDLRALIALDTKDYGAILQLGADFGKAAREKQAARLFEVAAKAAPHVALPQYVYGQFLINHRFYEKGLDYVARAIKLDPLKAEHYVARGFGLMGQGRIQDAVASYRKGGELAPDNAAVAGALLFALQHKPGVTKAELHREHSRWAALYRPGQPRDRYSFRNDPDQQRRLRIAVVSADLHGHAATFLALRAFEYLTVLGHELYCYKTDRKREDDNYSERYKLAAKSWRDVSDLDDAAFAAQIEQDGIDVLIDLSGHTAGNRLGVFAARAAPIQLTWAGYVGTLGLDTCDGVVSGPVEIPPEDEKYYVEPVFRMPDCYACYLPPDNAPDVAPLPGAASEHFTFGCFNRPAKVNEAVAAAWARILRAVPGSRIRMVYGGLNEKSTQDELLGVLSRGGFPTNRIDLIGDSKQEELLVRYGEVDLALDPFPYSGGVTTLEGMWMGVPSVTYRGDTFAGRHASAHLTAVGLQREFCAEDIDGYVELAVSWASRRDELAEIRRTLRDRVARSPLCDAPRFADNMSRELTRLWAGWCEGRRKTAA